MDIHYLGHAGFIVTINNTKILIDPWFHSAFFGAWFPYPDNSNLEDQVLEQHIDYLYISHTHEDHFDKAFLAKLNRKVKILCPNYRSGSLQQQLRQLGFTNFIVLGHKERYQGNDWSATLYLDISHKEDSGILLESTNARFLDLNDCNTLLSELPTNVTYLSAQYSGAMWYPNCYDYTTEIMRERTASVRQQLLNTLIRKVNIVKPIYYLPSAGPACFLDPELQLYNDRENTIFPTWDNIELKFHQHCPDITVIRLNPDDRLHNGITVPSSQTSTTDIASYADRRKQEWNIGSHRDIHDQDIEIYFTKLINNNNNILQHQKKLYISTESQSWSITLENNSCNIGPGKAEHFEGYHLTIPTYILFDIINGRAGWEEALLSMRVKLKRNPDIFDSILLGLLRYGNNPVQTTQMLQEGRRSEIIKKNGFCIQRYCPHAGEDLSYAQITDDIIECPRHHWQWNLITGECVKGGDLKIKSIKQ
jgi:UDP-MurNAc hydroxylase